MVTLTINEGAARTLSGEKAQRIIAAMRDSVAEVGIAGSTFERVSAKPRSREDCCTTTSGPRSGCWSR